MKLLQLGKIVGTAIIARTKAPDRMDHPKFKNITKNAKPNNPNTIEGIEANVSEPKRTNLMIF